MPVNPISAFEYSTILVSIILGLGITHLLSAFTDLLYNHRQVRFYWPQGIWVLFILFLHIQDWFITYQLKNKTVWTFTEMVFVLLYPISLFVIAKLLLPSNEQEEKKDMKQYYMSQYPVLFLLMSCSIFLSVLFNLQLLQQSLAAQVPLVVFFLVMLFVAVKKIHHPLLHKLIAAGLSVATVISVLLEKENWVIN
ncbi:MAG: hypothetical protein HZA79_15890 [Sphingobacteriales bacterium]|nr:hypothetical protein [Sphingobacteriales bacterium]